MESIKTLPLKPNNGPVEAMVSNSSASATSAQKDNVSLLKEARRESNARQVEESTNDKLNRIAEAMDSYVHSIQRYLKIQVHGGTGNIMVKVISQDTGKVIREIPSKEMLDLAAKMEEMTGTLFDENV